MPKTTRTPCNDGITDVTQCSIQQLTRLPAEVLRLHLYSCNFIVTGTKAVMARCLYDGIHPPPSSNVTPVSIATTATQPGLLSSPINIVVWSSPSSTSATCTSTLQATPSSLLPPQPATSANISPLSLPPAMQAQLSSLMAQFLQNATPVTSVPVTSASTDLLLASTVNAPRHLPTTIVHAPLLPPMTMACTPLQLPATVAHAQLQPTTIVHAPLQLPTTIVHTQLQPTVIHAPQKLPTEIAHVPLQQMMITSVSFLATYATPTLPAHHLLEITMPPVPTPLRKRILQGEFIDFSMLLHKAMFPDAMADPPHLHNSPSSVYLPLQCGWRPGTCTSL